MPFCVLIISIDYLERTDSGSRIEADWLISGQIEDELCYLFLVAKPIIVGGSGIYMIPLPFLLILLNI
jgi:hypothetical protein